MPRGQTEIRQRRLIEAALTRLGRRRAIALGEMDARRDARVERFGFIGWAGIYAWAGRRDG